MKLKAKKISSQIQRELSKIIMNETKNEIVKSLNITACEVTNDLSFAKIFYTYLGDYTKEEIASELEKTSSHFRKMLASKIDIRHTPELIFVFDESIEYGKNIEKLIEKIKEEK
ncbi:MAG: 30S ribosome-binding factor RbfA [Mollicutes bacterium]|jgi:ribosome-binding factor A|nr:30S ribosome-binding factor RbfA [Mollicutes bacterium]